MPSKLYTALIRTHHITSRKKVSTLKAAAKKLNVHAVLRSGGVPGVMFVEGETRTDVQAWVDVVHGLRYKDFKVVAEVGACSPEFGGGNQNQGGKVALGVLDEVESVREMGTVMEVKGLMEWWRRAMGFVKDGG